MADRILLVSPASPFTPQSGAQQRTALLYEALQTLGQVDVLLLEPTPGLSRLEPPRAGALACGFWHQRPFGIGKFSPDRALNLALRAGGLDLARYRLVVSRYLNPVAKLAIPQGVRTIVDLDDWGYHYAFGPLALTARIKSKYAAWLAQRQTGRFDAFFFVSRRDQARHPSLRSILLPNIPFNPPPRPFPQAESHTLLFVGSLWYPPNRDGINRFLARCWPTIKAARPRARLLLAGAAPAPVRAAWEQHPDVSAPGYVDDLDTAYRDAAVTIAPIYSGGGTNIKILESLAYGRVCVTTPYGADAFKAELTDAGLKIGHDDRQLANLCIEELDDVDRRSRQAQEGRTLIDRHFSRTLFTERVTQLCAAIASESLGTCGNAAAI